MADRLVIFGKGRRTCSGALSQNNEQQLLLLLALKSER